jgi:DNA-binding IclR family transcriptional regulator
MVILHQFSYNESIARFMKGYARMARAVNENDRSAGSLKTLRRGLDVLSLFGQAPEWTQSGISQATGLPMPTVYRLCLTLVEAGFLERDGHRLRCGMRLIELGGRALSALSPLDVVAEHLQVLADETGETANLGILVGGEVVYLRSAAGERLLRPQVATGSRAPAYCTAIGKCLLAQLDPDEARAAAGPEPYPPRTEHTPTSWRVLSAGLDRIRAQGMAESDQEYELGLYSIAMPVPSVDAGRPSAISVSPPTTRAAKSNRRLLAAELRRASDAIARAMLLISGVG